MTTNPTDTQQQGVNTALAVSSASAGALLMDTSSMERLERLADIMASGKTTVPQHLRGNRGDCFAICLQSMQWAMNPFAVAQKTHLVNGTLGYEAQLVAAVINNSKVTKDRFHFEWFGDWTKIVGKFKEVTSTKKTDDNGNYKKFIVPAWEQKDEHGLGVRVWATIRGESEPRVLELLLTQARTRNSTLWTEDPKQQLAYLAQKRWSRLYAPDVILGVYTPDELADSGERFMGMADVVNDPPAPPAPPATYDQAKFDANLKKWAETIVSGRKTAQDYIDFAQSRGEPFTEEQKAKLLSVKVNKAAAATDVTVKGEEPAAPLAKATADSPEAALTYAEIADRIVKAQTIADLDDLAEHIGAIADEVMRAELVAKAAAKEEGLPPF